MQGAPVYGMPPPSYPATSWPGAPQSPAAKWTVPPTAPKAPSAPPVPSASPAAALPPPPPGYAAIDLAKPKVRAVSQEVPPPPPLPARVVLPSPEALGIQVAGPSTAVAAVLDWNQVHGRLERLGAVHFQHHRLPQGGFRVVVSLPTPLPQQPYQVEATGATEAAAVLQALQQAEAWVASGR